MMSLRGVSFAVHPVANGACWIGLSQDPGKLPVVMKYLHCKQVTERLPILESGFDLGCPICLFGRLDGDFTPDIVEVFYARDYYAHRPDKHQSMTLLRRVLPWAAWQRDYRRDFDPGGLSDKTTMGCSAGNNIRPLEEAGYEIRCSCLLA